MDKLLIKNAKVVLPDTVSGDTSVLIENGKITAIGDPSTAANCSVLDADGGYLLAGFIDSHVHGGGGADFMDATAEAFETATIAHLKHGTTTLVPTSMSASTEGLEAFITAYLEFLKTDRKGAKTIGLHLEGPYLSGAGGKSKGAQRGDLLRFPDMAEVEHLYNLSEGHIIRWDTAPELNGALEFAKFLSQKNVICSIAHSTATTDEATAGFDSGFSHVTHCYNAVTTYRKEGQKVLDGIVEAAYLNDNVTIELICDGCHIPKGVLKLALKIKGDKVCAITDAMRIAGTDMKKGYLGTKESGSEVIVDDGVAKLPDMSSFAGSIATMDRCLKVLCHNYGVDICTASKMLSLSPARLHGIENEVGSIEVGKTADLVLVDSKLDVKNVILDGIIKI